MPGTISDCMHDGLAAGMARVERDLFPTRAASLCLSCSYLGPKAMTTFTSPSIDNELSEVDIGLSSLPLTAEPSDIRPRPSARPSGYTRAPPAPLSLATTPTQQYAQLKSPSSPNLTKMLPPPSPTTPRRPSRSKTLSRLPSGSMHRTRLSLDGMIMGPDKVARLRKWILSLVTGG